MDIHNINYEWLTQEIQKRITVHPNNDIYIPHIIDKILTKNNIHLITTEIKKIAEIIYELNKNIEKINIIDDNYLSLTDRQKLKIPIKQKQ